MSALVTVCVLTYNPNWIKFRNTLRSIVCQKNVDFDIVISDDGSKEDCFDKAESFFKENNYNSYKFVKNIDNQGTVKNAISALQHTDSKYVKLISPGDFLYDETSLYDFVDFAERNSAVVCFGNSVYYSVNDNGEIEFHNKKRYPKDLTPWIECDYKKIRRGYFYRRDYILGASLFCLREYLLGSLFILQDVVKYAEDTFLMYSITNKDKILFLNKPFVFYEYGSGISTHMNTNSIVNSDTYNMLDYLYKNNRITKYELLLGKTKSVIHKLLLTLLVDPLFLFKKLKPSKKIDSEDYGIKRLKKWLQ